MTREIVFRQTECIVYRALEITVADAHDPFLSRVVASLMKRLTLKKNL
jgi:hypothetical protein